jgi:pimeloyl-ACP methyl ester carboxylesterase
MNEHERVMKKRSELIARINYNQARESSDLFSTPMMNEQFLECSAGILRVLHFKPPQEGVGRPLVFLSGWGTSPEGFIDFFKMVSGNIECYYVETREKNSSDLPKGRIPMDMDQNARDLAEVIEQLQLTGKDYLLMGTCWGATVVGHAMVKKVVNPGTVVLYDPMPRLWFPQWLLKTVVPATPTLLWKLLLPLGRMIALWGMKEDTQRRRAHDVISNADLRKWKKASLAIGNYDLEELVPLIKHEVFVFTGVDDKIHGQDKYPPFTKAMPRGRLFDITVVEEAQRESLLGLIAWEFASKEKNDGVPLLFAEFEKNLREE